MAHTESTTLRLLRDKREDVPPQRASCPKKSKYAEEFSSLQQLTVAIKEAGQREDWMKAVALLEGKYGVLEQECRGFYFMPLLSL